MMDQPVAHDDARLVGQGWSRIRPSRFTTLIGPIWTITVNGRQRYAFIVEDKHDNTTDRAHGGMIMAFCDEALGLHAHGLKPADRLFTVGFECQFVNGAKMGDLVEIEPEIVNGGRSLVFMRGTCKAGERVIATCSGIWKRAGAARGDRTAQDGNGG
ncbi:thioesterase [Mesorhizobium sp. L-8-10]|uniref:PaaI family thioesterase n=1 Tax=Mesorhizobium sp. L-8-10 TaxID=2744523 RepID=UPI001926BB56|nr:PaaI family thioesterase [Mesorhizobium sp. L-8-10]BCH28229.1 thioesterase [Mesorhizobium sp. L-8-10]